MVEERRAILQHIEFMSELSDRLSNTPISGKEATLESLSLSNTNIIPLCYDRRFLFRYETSINSFSTFTD